MAGKGCIVLAVDRRFGQEGQLVSTDAKRVLKVRRLLYEGYRSTRYFRSLEDISPSSEPEISGAIRSEQRMITLRAALSCREPRAVYNLVLEAPVW